MSDVQILVAWDGPLEGAWVRTSNDMSELLLSGRVAVTGPSGDHYAGRQLCVSPSEEHWQKLNFLIVAGVANRYNHPHSAWSPYTKLTHDPC